MLFLWWISSYNHLLHISEQVLIQKVLLLEVMTNQSIFLLQDILIALQPQYIRISYNVQFFFLAYIKSMLTLGSLQPKYLWKSHPADRITYSIESTICS